MSPRTTGDPASAGPDDGSARTAFVLGGGGVLGACEVGMLRALLEAGISPDLVLGTSVGAINGAVFAADPSLEAVSRLEKVWTELDVRGVFEGSLLTRIGTAVRTRTHLHANEPLRQLLAEALGTARIEELPLRFECVAACIERAAETWFARGPATQAVLASCAVPGLLPAVEVDGEHYLDGGLVDSVPLGRAVELGARRIFVLHVGRVEQTLLVPRQPWEVAAVAFEISRRHRFTRALAELPEGVVVHLLPSGSAPGDTTGIGSYLRYRDHSRAHQRIENAYRVCTEYLRSVRP
ncbi:MAG TPA: patatin-like phospholipase family protein [Actinospica sp.]|nr:patatin-like phospholipase family protein [Actinospica sp.]